jgi:small subunit ribosomal protein S20
MPITSSAKKALRASKKKRVFNLRRKGAIEKILKEFRKFRKRVSAKDKTAAAKLIPSIYQNLDKAVKTDYLKANAAARTKSRVMAALKKLG